MSNKLEDDIAALAELAEARRKLCVETLEPVEIELECLHEAFEWMARAYRAERLLREAERCLYERDAAMYAEFRARAAALVKGE